MLKNQMINLGAFLKKHPPSNQPMFLPISGWDVPEETTIFTNNCIFFITGDVRANLCPPRLILEPWSLTSE